MGIKPLFFRNLHTPISFTLQRLLSLFVIIAYLVFLQSCTHKEWQHCTGFECTNIGVNYAYGIGVKQDYTKAKICYEKACKAQDFIACYNLAIMYEHGEGIEIDIQKAITLYEKSCKENVMSACYNAGVLQLKDNPYHAFNLFKKACDGINAKIIESERNSCVNLAVLTAQGNGTKKDLIKAKAMFHTLCQEGNALACKNYGILQKSPPH